MSASYARAFTALRFRAGSDSASDQARERILVALDHLESELGSNEYLVGDHFTVADLALYGYMQAAGEAGIDTSRFPRLEAWLERVRGRPRHVADLQPLPDNARPGKGRSIFDLIGGL